MSRDTIFIIIFICFLLFLIILGLIGLKENKRELEKNEHKKNNLVENNEFILEKKEKYEKIMDDNTASLYGERQLVKKRMILYGILVFVAIALYFIFKKPILIPLIPITIIVPGLIFGKQLSYIFSESSRMYNETTAAILKEYDNNLNYYPTDGFKREEYNSLYFTEPCDVYRSSDLITNLQNGFCYADVFIESIDHDDEGTTYNVEFDGSLARMNISNIGCTIILGGLGENSFMRNDTFKIIKFENDNFNKMFVCFSDNELGAYKILTPDVMEQFINIRNSSVGNIDIRIINDKLYIRFKGTNGFDGLEGSKNELFKSVAILDHIIKTMENVKKIIESKNMN